MKTKFIFFVLLSVFSLISKSPEGKYRAVINDTLFELDLNSDSIFEFTYNYDMIWEFSSGNWKYDEAHRIVTLNSFKAIDKKTNDSLPPKEIKTQIGPIFKDKKIKYKTDKVILIIDTAMGFKKTKIVLDRIKAAH